MSSTTSPADTARQELTGFGGALIGPDDSNYDEARVLYNGMIKPIQPYAIKGHGVPIRGRVLVTEISGSESVIHFELAGQAWVSQSHGVHRFEVGEHAELHADVGRAMFFDRSGNLVAG